MGGSQEKREFIEEELDKKIGYAIIPHLKKDVYRKIIEFLEEYGLVNL